MQPAKPPITATPNILDPVDFGGGPQVVKDIDSDIASIAVPQTNAGATPGDGSGTVTDSVISDSMTLIDLEDERDQLVQDIKANPEDRDDLIDQLKDISGQAEEIRGILNDPGFLGGETAGAILTWTPYVVDGAKIGVAVGAGVVVAVMCMGTAGAACVAAVATAEGVAAAGASFDIIDPLSGIAGNSIANYHEASLGGNGGAWTAATSVGNAVISQGIEEGAKYVGGKYVGNKGGGDILQSIGQQIGKATVEFVIAPNLSSGGGSTGQATLGDYSGGYHQAGTTSTASNGATVYH